MPTSKSTLTALVTGANSGLGFEAAAQLAEQDYRHVLLACRSLEKAETARAELVARVGKDVFGVVAVDVADLESSKAAALDLASRGLAFDVLLLNAGLLTPHKQLTKQGFEMTHAASLFGHHVLTMELLRKGTVNERAHIVIAGSEAVRGNAFPGMKLLSYPDIIKAVGGDVDEAMDAIARGEQPAKFTPEKAYCDAKVWTAWWAGGLARRVPSGIVVTVVSPGSVMATNASRNAPAHLRKFVLPVLKVIGPSIGMSAPVAIGAKRYIDATDFSTDASGKMFASPKGKLIGKLTLEDSGKAQLYDQEKQEVAWRALERLTGEEYGYTSPKAAA